MKEFDIVCFGECAIDHINQISPGVIKVFPKRISKYNVRFGGRGLNFISTAGIFDQSTLLISAVGVDYFSSGLHDYLKNRNISDARLYRTQDFDLPQAFIYNNGSDSKIYFYPGLWQNKVAEIKAHLDHCISFLKAKIIYCTSGIPSLNFQLLKNFSSRFKAFAPGHELPLYKKEELINIFTYIDALFLNKTESLLLEQKLGMRVGTILNRYDFNLIVITLEQKGSRLITKGGVLDIPACITNNVVDQTGAGDGFAAAFLATYLASGDLKYSAQIANATCSFLIETMGAQTNLLSHERIMNRYKKQLR